MRKLFFVFVLAAILMPATNVMAQHTEETSCSACHTPHYAGVMEGVPLWDPDHDIGAGITFTMYGEDLLPGDPTTLDATIAAEPDGSSRLCLSCHDGAQTDHPPGLTHDLSDDHPISFVYDTALATLDGELLDPTVALSFVPGSGGTVHEDLLHNTGKVQCVSCHDIHKSGVTTAFLFDIKGEVSIPGWGGSINSEALCKACHDK